jgi:hypothetical protein
MTILSKITISENNLLTQHCLRFFFYLAKIIEFCDIIYNQIYSGFYWGGSSMEVVFFLNNY